MAVSGRGDRPVLTTRRRLVRRRSATPSSRPGGSWPSPGHPTSCAWPDPPLRARQSILSDDYQAELRRHGIQISMSGKGNCYDNAMVETFFKTLKAELVWRTVFLTRAEAAGAIGRYIDSFYNPVRRHSALAFVSPAAFERHAAQ